MRGIFRRPCIDLFPDDGSKSPPSDPGSAERISSLPDLIEFNAKYNAPNLFAVQARSGQEDLLITFEGLKHAVDGCSTWLSTLKREKTDAPVALLLESDVLLFVHIAALLQLNVPVSYLLSVQLLDTKPHLVPLTVITAVRRCYQPSLDKYWGRVCNNFSANCESNRCSRKN